MLNIRKFLQGIRLIPVSSTAVDTKGELEVLDSNGKLNFHNGTTASPMVTEAHSATLTNKTIDADNNTISDLADANIKAAAAIDASKIADGSVSSTEFQFINSLTSNAQTQLTNNATAISDHLADTTDAHDASAISNVPAGSIAATDVQAAVNELDSDIQGHITDSSDAHDASAISNVPSGNLAATDVQSALNELQSDVDTRALSSSLTAHTGASSGVHGVTGAVVGTTDTQTLTNKTLTTPVISTISNTGTLTLPTSTDTLVGRATTDTLTNKTLTAPVISTISNTGTLTLPTSTDTLVGRATTDILTNKTLTAPVISTISNTGTLTLPTSTDTLVGRATTDTLTNKTLTSPTVNTPSTDVVTWDDQASTPSNPAAGFYKLYFKTDGNLYKLNSAGTETAFAAGGGSTNSFVQLSAGNGHGSTANKIRRFSNTVASSGSDITYADSATNGMSLTINTAGVYSMHYSDNSSGGATSMGVSVNASDLTASIAGISNDTNIAFSITANSDNYAMVSSCRYFNVNDVIRAHTDGGPNATNASRVRFLIARAW